jgi:hypothetical protein
MTSSLSLSTIPSDFRVVHRQFEQWRRVRQPGDRIPERLWAAAVAVARTHGVSRTARLLHLEGQKLKHRVTGAGPGPQSAMAPTFVEVLPSSPASGECTIEVKGPRGGRLRIQLRGAPVPDLAALARVVWGPAA